MTNKDTEKRNNSPVEGISVGKQLPFVSVIVPVYSDLHHLGRLIESIKKQSYPKECFELLIVDNGTGESLGKYLAGLSNSKILHEQRPSSYAARNRGIQEAKGSVLAFTDVDCVPDRDWLMRGIEALQSAPNIGFVGGEIEVFPERRERLTLVELFEILEDFNQERFVTKWAFAATANMFTKKDVMKHIGMFDTNLKSSGDHEWGTRAVRAGYLGIWSPSAIVKHPARKTLGQFFRKTARIQGGQYDLYLKESKKDKWSLVTKLWGIDWPNRQDFGKLFQNKNYTGVVKAKLVFMFILYKAFRTLELIRLLAGGESKRT